MDQPPSRAVSKHIMESVLQQIEELLKRTIRECSPGITSLLLFQDRSSNCKGQGATGIHSSLLSAWEDDSSNEKRIPPEDPPPLIVQDRSIPRDFLSSPSSVTPAPSVKSNRLFGVWRLFSFLPNLLNRRLIAAGPRRSSPCTVRTYIFEASMGLLTNSDSQTLVNDALTAIQSQPMSRWRRDVPIRVSCSLDKMSGLEVWTAKVNGDSTWVWTGEQTMNLTQGSSLQFQS